MGEARVSTLSYGHGLFARHPRRTFRGTALWAIPAQETTAGLGYLTWALRELDKRGLNVRVETRQTYNGIGVGLSLADGDALKSERTDQWAGS